MLRRLVAVTATASALTLALAGCGGGNSGTGSSSSGAAPASTTASSAGGANAGAVAWAEKVCSTVAPQVAQLSQAPNLDPSDPVKAKTNLDAYFDKQISALDTMASGFQSAGAPPVADGDQLVEKATAGIKQAKTVVESAKTELASVDTSTPEAFQAGFVKVAENLQKLSESDDPTASLKGNQELDAAFQQAPTCKKLDGDAGASASNSSSPTS
ncbi:hypothetical protein [Actinokineospora sp. NBRC 105648]|uniref:hypothetical protein n=1 Tax=Actinokineospora sp. NBRC 105648 TaxID=3032206 RepID=UPI0024A4E409|nr:hypothetical protein [Actinokineospora sp. NBRC 105648]GLZ40310.1 hypothetical protein Acsp05_39340 [Actinokineospora sp. NBRC 105648]